MLSSFIEIVFQTDSILYTHIPCFNIPSLNACSLSLSLLSLISLVMVRVYFYSTLSIQLLFPCMYVSVCVRAHVCIALSLSLSWGFKIFWRVPRNRGLRCFLIISIAIYNYHPKVQKQNKEKQNSSNAENRRRWALILSANNGGLYPFIWSFILVSTITTLYKEELPPVLTFILAFWAMF